MKKEVKNISLSFQCNESWNDMTQNGTGRHCEKCNHKVNDFRNASEEEYNRIVKESNTRVCGLFKASQTNNNFMVYAATTTMLAAAFLPVACSPELIIPEQPIDKIETLEVDAIVMGVPVNVNDSSSHLFILPEVMPDSIMDKTEPDPNLLDPITETDSTAAVSE